MVLLLWGKGVNAKIIEVKYELPKLQINKSSKIQMYCYIWGNILAKKIWYLSSKKEHLKVREKLMLET